MTDTNQDQRWRFVEGVFHAACALPPEQRDAFLDRVCGDDAQLRADVDSLLDADNSTTWLGKPIALAAEEVLAERSDPGQPLAAGTTVGPYRILEQIGEGGMGEVYLAEQEQPVRRRVALKLIKLGMDTRQVVARFESERQALAIMNHPNVAKVFDAGSTERGRPYFAMEFVRGVQITEYCDRNRLTTVERLELFMRVCDGVQHAHQKGIIHRDIKPSNVLVQVEDDRPTAKIIDFGVAKATDYRLTDKTVYTGLGMMIGTPAYMSPEQAEQSGMDVDTRSDVYSLGVLLYELLVGASPLDAEHLAQAGFDEIRRRIQQDEPSRPSTRVSVLSDEGADFVRSRQTDPGTLARSLEGDLDWITLKALEKDRTRRYQTANALGMDIQRHLRHEPVSAGPPGAAYRLKKFARRHRALIGSAAFALTALIVGLAVALTGMVQARRERARAEQQTATAVAINEFLVRDLLAEAAPENNPVSSEVTVLELLDRAAAKLDGAFEAQPVVGASVRGTVADTYYTLGSYEQAERHWRTAAETLGSTLGEGDGETMNAWSNLAMSIDAQGGSDEAEAIYRRLLETMDDAADIESRLRFTVTNNLAESRRRQGDFNEAERLHEQNLEARRRVLGPEDEGTLETMNNLAAIYFLQGRLDESETMFVDAWELRKRVLGPEHPLTLITMSNLAVVRKRQGKLAEAEPLLRMAYEADRRIQGAKHPDTLTDMHNLANLLQQQGKYDEASELFEQTIELRREVLGTNHPLVAVSLEGLGMSRADGGDPIAGERAFRAALEIRLATSDVGHPGRIRARLRLGDLLAAEGRAGEARIAWNEAWAEIESGQVELPEGLRDEVAGRLAPPGANP